ncbi:hypothetical protein RhiirA4_470940 [Rhizophagus irregularis]|uniref:Uncharacterized protein n=1 Tax=Rhizophagus irregularis TaxID=588596 RepID=A0A2I1GHU4_9GLOM|nr:hypothetical protein RhiirA4_461015 [Rhizophagus irregularis]PKY52978.1 hypothetical protein RhiirA4_470940 [Rhizophagus irregularis]
MCHQLMITKSWECILGDLDYGQAKGLGLALYELDSSKDWETHLMHIFKSCVVHFQRNLFNKHFSQETYNLAKSILNAPSQESVESILNAIESSDESGAKDWAKYYKTPWIISSLNINMSKMERQIWRKYGNNTNAAEAAHALINREGKQLKLLSAILWHDEKLLKIKSTQDNSGVPYTRCDKSEVKRQQIASNRKAAKYNKKNETKNSCKRKTSSINSNEKRLRLAETVSNTTNLEDINNEIRVENLGRSSTSSINKENEVMLNIELEERKLALLERQAKLRKEVAEAEAIELQNRQLKISMGLTL